MIFWRLASWTEDVEVLTNKKIITWWSINLLNLWLIPFHHQFSNNKLLLTFLWLFYLKDLSFKSHQILTMLLALFIVVMLFILFRIGVFFWSPTLRHNLNFNIHLVNYFNLFLLVAALILALFVLLDIHPILC